MSLSRRNTTVNRRNKRSHKGKQILHLLLLSSLATSCSTGIRYSCPANQIPCEWNSPLSSGMNDELPDCFLWWEALNDPILNSLMERAARHNLDLYIAGTRIIEARIGITGANAQMLPHVDGSLTAGQLYFNRDGIIRDILCNSCPGKKHVGFFEAGFDASWEIDLFGMYAHERDAACAAAEAAEEGLLDVWVTLSAEVAMGYVELRGLQKREELLIEGIAIQRDALDLTRDLTRTGFTSTLERSQAENELHLLEGELFLIKTAIAKMVHRLSVLIGHPPAELFCELMTREELPRLPNDKPVGIPSELLRRRPDIRKAERNLAAATERMGSAVASFFPRISLTGFLGRIASDWHNLSNPTSATAFIAPGLLLPIFNSTLITQGIDLSRTQTQQALYVYQKTILEAFEETENAITSLHYETMRNCTLKEIRRSSQQSYDLTLDLYDRGFKSYLEVIATNRTFLSAADAEIQANVALLRQYIALYKALGGGWELDDCQN
jgi:multidrug efflux system outer membrane protein